MKSKIENILFICTGNTCRSPIAEALFKQKKGVKKSWKCISAGTHAIENLPASLEAQIVVKDKGGNLKNHKSRLVNKNLMDKADLILVMTEGHKRFVNEVFKDSSHKVYLLSELGTSESIEIGDPFGSSLEKYKIVSDQIEKAIYDLITFLNLGED